MEIPAPPNFPEFEPFPKIPRQSLGCVITEKIDGTNAQILVTSDGQVFAGSRSRWIWVSGDKRTDNYGFAAWVEKYKEQLIKELGPGRHFGEWWGEGIQKRYNNVKGKRFSLFNSRRWAPAKMAGSLVVCDVVPVLYEGDATTSAIDETFFNLQNDGSIVAPGCPPEGIVICYPSTGHLVKRTYENNNEPKGKKVSELTAQVQELQRQVEELKAVPRPIPF